MTLIAFFGGIETGLIYALVALGVLISFRILDFPDLTADGSFPLGAVVFAVSVGAGVNPWLACLLGALAGAAAGTVTAWLHVSLNILPLLASILVMVALYSLNLRITGGTPNLPLIDTPSVFSPFTAPDFSNQFWIQPLIILIFVIAAKLLLDWFFNTKTGLAVRATGINARMARAQGVPTSKMIVLGMALSNALIALGGALFAQTSGSADMSSGIGTHRHRPGRRHHWRKPAAGKTHLPHHPFRRPRLYRLSPDDCLRTRQRTTAKHRRAPHRPEPDYRRTGRIRPATAGRQTPSEKETDTMMRADNLKVTFNPGTAIENPAMRGMSLHIRDGEFVTVIGSNGAGKSTFLNAVSGDLMVDSGSIHINGRDVTRLPAHKRAHLVARVFQDPLAGTCEALSIEENMALAYSRGRKRGLGFALNRQNRELFREKLALLKLGLENRLTDRIGLLSGGQRQAVSLLMASLQPSKILLLDEHTAALDPKTAAFVMELTEQIVADNKLTAMMVTHSMRQALDHGSRTVMLHQGRVVLDVGGEKRAGMDVPDLLDLFERTRGEQISDDSLLLD